MKIEQLRTARGWTVYRLFQESGVSEATIHQWVNKNRMPTIKALQQICKAFAIELSDFFADSNTVEMTPENKTLFDNWQLLTKEERIAVEAFMKTFIVKK